MGAAESGSNSAKYIKPSVRKAIKKLAYISQIAKCVSLIPSPEQFANQVVSEVAVLAGKIKMFSERIGRMLEEYGYFPTDFITDATNNMMGTINNITGVGAMATQGMVDALHQATDDIDLLTTDTVGILTDIVTEDNTATRYLGNTVDSVHEGLDKVTDKIDEFGNSVSKLNDNVKDRLQKAVDYINEKMKKVNDDLNNAFGDYMVVGLPYAEKAVEGMNEYLDSQEHPSLTGNIVASTSDTMSSIVKNFNIGKITKGLMGAATNIGLVAAGIDQLPQLNMENVLAFGRAKHKVAGMMKEFKESDEYKRMVEDAEGDKKKMREILRQKRRASAQEVRRSMSEVTKEEREAKRSVAKDVRKAKLKAKRAKIAQKTKEMIKLELERFKYDIKMFSQNIKDDWMTMEAQYASAVEEIKFFFTGDPNTADGSKYIDQCCDAIELDCDNIKETLKNLTTTITVDVSQIPAPTSVGQCFDNPLYKILRWFECMKLIFNEIKKVINFGIDIIRQVNKIAKIILNGINSLKEIKEKLIELLNIKWLLDFIDSIIELFRGKCLEGKELLENTVSPVYFNETDEYELMMEAMEKKAAEYDDDNDIEKEMDALEELGESIFAYKSPIMNEDGTDFKGWIFYHSDIDNMYRNDQKLKRKFSKLIMKRASKTGHRKKGGVFLLKNRNVFKLHTPMTIDGKREYTPKAYDAFYWYTKWTTDPNDDSVNKRLTIDADGNISTDDNGDVVSPVMTTENGTLVELDDGRRVFVNDFGIRSGDYVIVEGKRYRVK